MKVIVDVDSYVAKQVKGEAEAISTRLKSKKLPTRKYAEAFAQNLINRYFSAECLDAEDLVQMDL